MYYSASGGALTQCRMGRAISAALQRLVTVFPAVCFFGCCLFCFAFFFFFFLTLRDASDLNISSHFCLPSLSPPLLVGVVVGASVDGQWQEWSSWSDCSVTCANGTQQRTRQCSAAAHGGSECRGHWAESRECHNPDCTGNTKILSLLILHSL